MTIIVTRDGMSDDLLRLIEESNNLFYAEEWDEWESLQSQINTLMERNIAILSKQED